MAVGEGYIHWESNAPAIAAKLQHAQHGSVNRGLFEIFEDRYIHYMSKLFETEGAWGDGKWEPLTDDWARRKKLGGLGSKIGYRSGAMLEALTGGPGFSSQITDHTAEFGIKPGFADYAQYFSMKRSLEVNHKERSLWQETARLYYGAIIKGMMATPSARSTPSVQLPGGYMVTVDKNGRVHYRTKSGLFASSRMVRRLAQEMNASARSRKDAELNSERNK